MTIYPNLSNGYEVSINLTFDDSYEIEISPMNARVIYEDIGSGSILKLINLSLAIGMHMVQAT
ncbi:MAG: hypothetical protein ACI865_003458, partial [Flavobacteriaceae bacterium]